MITGIINKVWTKNVTTRYGDKDVTLFSIEGGDKIFNVGFGKQDIRPGDEVSFSYDGPKYGEFQVDKKTLKITSRDNPHTEPAETPKPAPSSGGGGGSSGGGSGGSRFSRGTFPLDFQDGQRSILRQHAFTQASEVVREGLRADGGLIPDDSAFVDRIIRLAYKIERYTSGDDLRDEFKEE